MAVLYDINPHNFPRYSEADMQNLEERHRNETRSLRSEFEYAMANRAYPRLYDYPWDWGKYSLFQPYVFGNKPWDLPQPFTITKKEVSLPVANKTHIIIGTSGASIHPTAHTTLADAEKEARRLAQTRVGEEFTIYTTAKSFKVEDKPVTVKTFI